MTEAIGSYTPTYEPMTAASLAALIACEDLIGAGPEGTTPGEDRFTTKTPPGNVNNPDEGENEAHSEFARGDEILGRAAGPVTELG